MSVCRIILLTFVALFSLASRADESVSLDTWQQVPVLDNGRVKPLDTYARGMLLAFSGKSTFDRQPAIDWLTRVLFAPETTRNDAIFLVNHPEVVEALDIEAEGRDRYSYAQLEKSMPELARLARAGFQKDQDSRSLVDDEAMRLYNNLTTYERLTQSFDFLTPRPEFDIQSAALRKDLSLPETGDLSYLDLYRSMPRLNKLLSEHQGKAAGERTDYEQDLFRVSMLARMWSQQRRGNLPPTIFPQSGRADEQWIGAWEALISPAGAESYDHELRALNEAVRAFRSIDAAAFDRAAKDFLDGIHKHQSDTRSQKLNRWEVMYNKSDAFYRSEILYGLAFLIALASVAFQNRRIYILAVILAVLALLPHTFGIFGRMMIMGRPPVTNLYSTFIFVSWCCALIGLAVEYFQRNRLGLITSSSMGLALLLTARRFGADGDTMGVMVAVLDSNFWLATHVVTITIGYAGCVASGVLGHIYLLQALKRDPDHPELKQTFNAVYGAQAFGLIFAFLGTMLGGVWADQSWGRFWGWDPKENGALVIVLWSAILFHARLGRMLGPRGFAAGSVLGVIWVLLAWLGVNLLSVGLHSYGFTSGIARGLAIACGFELLFVLVVTPFARRKLR